MWPERFLQQRCSENIPKYVATILQKSIAATLQCNISQGGHSDIAARLQKHFVAILQYCDHFEVMFPQPRCNPLVP